MHKQKDGVAKIILCIAAVALLVIVGILWKNSDTDRIKNLNYITHSQLIAYHYELSVPAMLDRLKSQMKQDGMYILDEYAISDSRWEIIGQPNRFWLTSEFMNKITIIDTIARPRGSTDPPRRTLLAYDGSIHSGSKIYLAVAIFILGAILTLMINKNNIPHIYLNDSENNSK